jgi:hypothetical protein
MARFLAIGRNRAAARQLVAAPMREPCRHQPSRLGLGARRVEDVVLERECGVVGQSGSALTVMSIQVASCGGTGRTVRRLMATKAGELHTRTIDCGGTPEAA